MENEVTKALNASIEGGYKWVRQDPEFPDSILVDSEGRKLDLGYEVKAWYTMSTELTGRFRESVNLLAQKNVYLVVIAWHLTNIVYGVAKVSGVCIQEAHDIAKVRDLHYHNPPDYLCEEPEDTTERTSNLQQTNVNGYKWQGSAKELEQAKNKYASDKRLNEMPWSTLGSDLTNELHSSYRYRLDTNFAKLDRINHSGIEDFKTAMLESEIYGIETQQWVRILKNLNDEVNQDKSNDAMRILEGVFNSNR